MFRPVIASDGNNYEECNLNTWLKDSDLSPLDNSKITANGLFYNRQLKNQIEEFVRSVECPVDMKTDWEEAREEAGSKKLKAKQLFDAGNILEAANLGYPEAEGMMAHNYTKGKGGFAVD